MKAEPYGVPPTRSSESEYEVRAGARALGHDLLADGEGDPFVVTAELTRRLARMGSTTEEGLTSNARSI